MANPLTGDFDAVLQVSGSTVNRLLATMHQNDGSKPSIPTFPHGVWIRVGDPVPIHGMKGWILGQASVPHIDLIHGVSDRFWLELSIRARYLADKGSLPVPEFIHGTVRAQYRIETIDPSCWGWQKLAPDYLWIRAVGDTVSFTGTAEDDSDPLLISPTIVDPATADMRITQLAKYLLTNKFEATPHKVSRRFRRGSMRSLNVGANRSAVVVPIGIGGDPSAGRIDSVNQDILEGKDVGIAVSKDFILGKIQEQLDILKAQFVSKFQFHHRTYIDLGFLGDVDVVEITIDYTSTLASATADWLGGLPTIGGFGIPGGLVSIHITGHTRTANSLFNFDFDVTQLLLISFDASVEEFSATPFGSAVVHITGTFGPIIEPFARPRVQSEVAAAVKNAAGGMTGELSLSNRKAELISQLRTMDDAANVWFETAAFTADGVIVRGRIGLTGRRGPQTSFTIAADGNAFSAYASWIPGGRVDAFAWSWSWFNNAGSAGSETLTDRFMLRRPGGGGIGRFGIARDLHRPLPGLDGMGQVCLVVRGVHVHAVTGDLVPVSATRRCKRFGFDIRLATNDRVFVREWVPKPGPRDPIGPVAELAVHEVSGPDAMGHGANTLVVRVGDQWNREVAMSLRDGLANSRRTDAGMVVLILFSDGRLMRQGSDMVRELDALAGELEAPMIVNEDVRGSWSKALGMETREGEGGEIEWRLVSPTGGVTWAHTGPLEVAELSHVLDNYLFKSPMPDVASPTSGIAVGKRLTGSEFVSDVVGHFTDVDAVSACPPPPFGRIGVETSATFVTKNSRASDAAVRKLGSSSSSGATQGFQAVVFEGSTAEEVEQLRQTLPENVMAIADPDGMISKRFGVRAWPSTVNVNEMGLVTSFEAGVADVEPTTPASGEAS